MVNRRKFNTALLLDAAYVENLIGSAINNMRDAKNVDGSRIYKYHNVSSVIKFIDKYYNIKIVTASDSSVSSSHDVRASYRLFNSLYKKSASRYKIVAGNNFSFEPKEKLGKILLKAVEDLFRI